MASVIVSGRPAWVAAIGFGVLALIIGLVMNQVVISIGGAGFAAFGIVFLIISLVTKGRAD